MKPTYRTLDENGYLLIEGCPISASGVFEYSAQQLGLPELEIPPETIVNVYRPESEISSKEAVDSFKNIPFIDEHEILSGLSDEDGTAPEEYGIDGVSTSNVYYASPWLKSDLKVFSRKLQKSISSGKVDISLGFRCKYTESSGTFDGKDYQFIQTQIRGNHISLVGDGRVEGARVLDGKAFDQAIFKINQSDEAKDMTPEEMARKEAEEKSAADNHAKDNKGTMDNDSVIEKLRAALNAFLDQEAKEPEHNTNDNIQNMDDDVSKPTSHDEDKPVPNSEEPKDDIAMKNQHEEMRIINELSKIMEDFKSQMGSAMKGEMEDKSIANDAVQGLQDHATKGEKLTDVEPTKNPKASSGPQSGYNSIAKDEAIKHLYADMAAKDNIYKRVSKIIGSFDHTAMDSAGVAKYAVQKLKIAHKAGFEVDAVDNYLNGYASAQQKISNIKQHAMDESSSNSELDAYIKGE